MYLDNEKWFADKDSSCFTSRNNADIKLHDITILKRVTDNRYGLLHFNSRRYTVVMVLDAETKEIVINYGHIPEDILNTIKTHSWE